MGDEKAAAVAAPKTMDVVLTMDVCIEGERYPAGTELTLPVEMVARCLLSVEPPLCEPRAARAARVEAQKKIDKAVAEAAEIIEKAREEGFEALRKSKLPGGKVLAGAGA